MTAQLLLALLIFLGTILIFRAIWMVDRNVSSAHKYELALKYSSYTVSLFILAFLSAWPSISNADKKIDATKTIIWNIPVVPAPAANVFGRYTWDLTAVAQDNHVNALLSSKSPTGLDSPNWKIGAGLPAAPKTTGLAGGPVGAEPSAKADVTFMAGAPVGAVGGPGKVTGSMHIVVEADTVPPTAAHGNQNAHAKANSTMTISTGTVTSVEVSQPGAATVVINADQFKGTVGFGADTGTGKLTDPLSVTLTDLTLGTSITENLFSSDFEGAVNGEWSFGSNGISLNVPQDGVSSASISLDFLSSWITDSTLVDSMISLNNGVFNTSGLFTNLPWVVTPTSVSLSSGVLNSIEIPYQIPVGLLDPSHLYDVSLTSDLAAQVSATVPEPSTFALSALGLILFLPFARRARAGRSRETEFTGWH